MNSTEFEARIREFEMFHGLRVPRGNWIVLRVDGRAFHSVTAAFIKPFDDTFHAAMKATAERLFVEFSAVYAFTESDEISVLLDPENSLFGRSVEKLVSLSASAATLAFNDALAIKVTEPALFDSRVIVLPNEQAVVDYFSWRQADTSRCCLNGWAYWALRDHGASAREATQELLGMTEPLKHELLRTMGVNFAQLPDWQKNGTGVARDSVLHEGYNPVTNALAVSIKAPTRAFEIPVCRENYRNFIRLLLERCNLRQSKAEVQAAAHGQ